MADTLLDIIDENETVIGQALRSHVHATGLLHREIHVWFITPDKQIVLQKRSMTKETNPGRLTAAVGGHVELGQTYAQAALMEIAEETGLDVTAQDIVYFATIPTQIKDAKIYNRSRRAVFGMVLHQPTSALQVEAQDGAGFMTMHISRLDNLSADDAEQMSPDLIADEFLLIRDRLAALVA